MVPETCSEKNSRWLKVVLALCALVVLPQGVSHAQDFGAVERHLGVAVAEGMLTLEQASHMMEALRHTSQGEQHQAHEKTKATQLEEVARKLKEAVAAGKLSEADAKAKWQAVEKEVHGKGDRATHHDEVAKIGAFLKQTGEHLRAAVEDGKLTEDQAWAHWQELKKNKLGPWLEGAIEKGSLTQEAARDIWHGIKLAEVGQKLKSAVEKGELTEAEAKAKWAEIERKAHPED